MASLTTLDDIITMFDDSDKYNMLACIEKELEADWCWKAIKETDPKSWNKEQKAKITKFCTTLFGNMDVVAAVASKIAKKKEAEDNYNNAINNATKTSLIRDTAAGRK